MNKTISIDIRHYVDGDRNNCEWDYYIYVGDIVEGLEKALKLYKPEDIQKIEIDYRDEVVLV